MTLLWRLLFSGARSTSLKLDLALLVVRLWVGIPMAAIWGAAKLPPAPGFVTNVGNLGFPLPTFFAWCAALSEVVGGGLLVLGVMTRPAAFFLGFTMFVASFLQKANEGFWEPSRLNPTHYLVFCVVLLLAGAGRLSVDQVLRPTAGVYDNQRARVACVRRPATKRHVGGWLLPVKRVIRPHKVASPSGAAPFRRRQHLFRRLGGIGKLEAWPR